MGFIVADGSENVPWIRAIMERHERLKENATLKRRPDVEIRHWSPNEWRDQEHLHQHQHHRQQQQQQQQEQQLRRQQYQQRQNCFRYRQQQQQHQYLLQQQHETSRRWQHQQHHKQEIAKKASDVLRVEVRADGETAQAEKGSAPPTSQTTLKPQSLSEYPVVLFASQQLCRKVLSSQDEQLDRMENGLLRKPVREEISEKVVGDSEGPQQPMHAAQPWPCLPVEEAGIAEMGMLGKDLVVAGGLVVSAGGAGAEEQRPPFWDDGNISVVPGEKELEIAIVYARRRLPAVSREDTFVGDGKVVVGDGSLVMEFGAQDSPLLQQQQQERLAPPPQEPWPPPIMAVEHGGSGADVSGESRLELERRVLFGDGLGDSGEGADDESFLGRDDDFKSDRLDGRAWERAGIGTGAGSRAFWGCEVAGRCLTRRRRERVREN